MTTNFALSLSFEGIELLHRVTRGWKRVGTADVEDENLDTVLAELRAKALKLEPSGLYCKLVIPMDQIKYLAIDSTQTNLDDIHAALDGATPYDLDDLVVDYERSGGRTHVAAVARETLQEAESFASAHQFNPVAFVAVPEPFTFQKEVFFGATSVASDILGADVTVDRDILPVMKVGTRVKSRLLIMDPLPDEMVQESEGFDLAAALASIIDEQATEAPEPAAEIEEVTEPEIALEQQAAPVAENIVWIDRILPEFHAPMPELPDVIVPETVEAPRASVIPENPVLADISGLNPIIAEYHAPVAKARKPVLRAFSATASAPNLGAAISATKSQTTQPAANSTKKPFFIAGGIAASVAAVALFAWAQVDDAPIATPVSETVVLEATDVSPSTTIAEAPETVAEEAPEVVVAEAPLSDVAPTAPDLTIAGIAQASVNTSETNIPAQLNAFITPTVPVAVIRSTVGTPPTVFTTTPPPPREKPAQVASSATPGRVLSPAEAQAAYDATGVWQRAPRFFDTPRIVHAAEVDIPASVAAPDRLAQPGAPSVGGVETDLSFIAPVNPPAPDVVFEVDENGHIIPTAEGTLTPQGAVVYAGLPDLNVRVRPELSEEELAQMALTADAPDGVVVIAGRPDVVPPVRPEDAALPEPDETSDAPSAGAVGLDALTGDTESLIASAAPDNTVRPRARPEGLVPLSPTPDLSTPDITSILEEVIAESAAQPFVDATPQAVATSLRPTTRPRNFDRVVTAARQRQATQPAPAPAAAPPAAASVAPQNYAPVPGGVARAATQDGAIRLRDLNLIGIYGRPNSPRALVRLGNGRYQHVEVGSSLDGGQVTAIGNGVLNYVKRGRTLVLELPGD
ncbi:hypothetical protein [Yoonia maritima]|uniref:hypothetical protein n=1 Tax=Yoonia maritima TaxID=1435347 RepID=UPI0037367BF9